MTRLTIEEIQFPQDSAVPEYVIAPSCFTALAHGTAVMLLFYVLHWNDGLINLFKSALQNQNCIIHWPNCFPVKNVTMYFEKIFVHKIKIILTSKLFLVHCTSLIPIYISYTSVNYSKLFILFLSASFSLSKYILSQSTLVISIYLKIVNKCGLKVIETKVIKTKY